MGTVDLHLHTRYSDGSYTPDDLLAAAAGHGLVAIAVTDHDTTAGVAACQAAGHQHGIEVVAGAEITCAVNDREIHLLAYFFGDHWQDPMLQKVLAHAREVRDQRIDAFVAKLNELGIELTRDDVIAGAGEQAGTLARPHIARALVARQVVKNTDEAFTRFLRRGGPAYVERYRMTAREAIGHVRRAGGVPVLAHPGLNRVDPQIRELVDQGLLGLEVWHSKHSPAQVERYLQLTEQLGLIATGGSDCHGGACGKPLIGSVTVGYERLETLRATADKLKPGSCHSAVG